MRLRRRSRAGHPISLQTTAMIDIVFLLLVFFILTFRIVAAEGDLNLAMPKQSAAGPAAIVDFFPITLSVKLEADDSGDLSRLTIDGKLLEATDAATAFAALQDYVRRLVGPEVGSSENFEVELECDAKLKYKYLIEAMTAVSGYRVRSGDDDRIVPLITAIRFAR